jgi:hypothetical protein
MAKWSRIETVLTPFLMAKQAREKGDMEASEGYAKRATDMMSSLVEMAKLKQQIDMAPSEIDYKKALSKQAYATAGESEQRAEKSRYDIERQKQTDIDFAKVAQGLGLDSANPDVIKFATAVKEYGARANPELNYYGKQAGSEASEFASKGSGFDYAKLLNDQRVSQDVAPSQVGAEKTGYEITNKFGIPKAQAELESKQGGAMYDVERGNRAPEIISAEIEADKRRNTGGGGYTFNPWTTHATIRDDRYKLQYALDAVRNKRAIVKANLADYEKVRQDTEALYADSPEVLRYELGKIKGITSAAEVIKILDQSERDLIDQYNGLVSLYNQTAGMIGAPAITLIPQPVITIEKKKAWLDDAKWKVMSQAEKANWMRTYDGLIFDTNTVNEATGEQGMWVKPEVYEKNHPVKPIEQPNPAPTKTTQPVKTTPPEKPVGKVDTGNKVVERSAISQKAQDAIAILKKAKITSVKQLSAERILAMKQQGIYDEVAKYLGE